MRISWFRYFHQLSSICPLVVQFCLLGFNMLESFCKILKKKIKCGTASNFSPLLPNKVFVSMIKMSHPVIFTMGTPHFCLTYISVPEKGEIEQKWKMSFIKNIFSEVQIHQSTIFEIVWWLLTIQEEDLRQVFKGRWAILDILC